MAQTRKRKGTNKKKNYKTTYSSLIKNKQLIAIILFVSGILSFCIAIIDAEGLWGALRTLTFGVFGFSFSIVLFTIVPSLFTFAPNVSATFFTVGVIAFVIVPTPDIPADYMFYFVLVKGI